MIVLLTGTPGTGKSTLGGLLEQKTGLKLYPLSELIGEDSILEWDERRDTLVVSIEEIYSSVSRVEDGILEGHLSHLLPFEDPLVIVLRAEPRELKRRLRDKGFSEEKIEENVEAEALDVCLIESMERHRKVYEIDTTNLSPRETLQAALDIIYGRVEGYLPGRVDFSYYFMER